MAMNDDCQVEYHFMTEQKFKIEDNDYQFEVDSFDFGGRFEMDFDAGF